MTTNTDSKHEKGFKRFLIFGGIFNILSAILFVFPWTINWYVKQLSDMNQNLHLGGAPIPLINDPFTMALLSCLGNSIVLIGAICIYCSFEPIKHRMIPLFNAIARIVFCLLVLYYAIFNNLPRIIIGFGLMDGIIGSVFINYEIKITQVAKQSTNLPKSMTGR